jgi:hypothetical protein
MRDKVVRLPGATAITAQRGCKLTLVHCDIRAGRGVVVNDGSLVLEDSRIEATEVGLDLPTSYEVVVQRSTIAGPLAIRMGRSHHVEVRGATISGDILPLDARILGLTDVLIEQVTKTPHALRPLDLLDRARDMTRMDANAKLVEIEIVHAGANGLVDLDAPDYKGSVAYTWELPLPVAPTAPPVVRPGLTPPPVPEPKRRIVKSVLVDMKGMHVTSGKSDEEAPVERVSPPRCELPRLWDAARRAGAPENAVARVIFAASGGGAWRFEIPGTPIRLVASNDSCDPVAPGR